MTCVVNIISIAQVPGSITDIDTNNVAVDTLLSSQDNALDTSKTLTDTLRYSISGDALDEPVHYDAQDSIEYNILERKVYMWGAAVVDYADIHLQADYIELDYGANTVYAKYALDSMGQKVGLPSFKDGQQSFTSDEMKYNYETKKGIISQARTEEKNLYILSEKAKFLTGDSSAQGHHVAYGQRAIFTTCDHPEPHYGIRSSKQKIVTDETVVVGPSNVEIMGVPTPLILPFGFFPAVPQRKHGVIFPQGYEYSENFGFGLENVGYYFPLGQRADLALSSDLYFRGSYRARLSSKYKLRYKSSGNINMTFARLKVEELGQLDPAIDKSFEIYWNHVQDPKAHPYNSFNAKVDMTSNNFLSQNEVDAASQLRNTISSNVTFARRFPNSLFSFSAALRQTQLVQTGEVTLRLPDINWQVQRLFPFKSKTNMTSKTKWYDAISLRYSGDLNTQVETFDSLYFSPQEWKTNFGVQNKLSTDASYRILKYLNFTPSINYTALWYLKGEDLNFVDEYQIEYDTIINPADPTEYIITPDTIAYGYVDTINQQGFKHIDWFTSSANLSTQVFGTLRFKKGKFRGIRHIMKPNISINYSPDYTTQRYGYYDTLRQILIDGTARDVQYYRFTEGMYGRPPNNGQSFSISYGITNIIEGKSYSKKRREEKIFRLIDNLSISGSYNFAADSLNWSDIYTSAVTKFFGGMVNLNVTSSFTPYAQSEDGSRTINTYYRKVPGGKFLRYLGGSIRLNSGLPIAKVYSIIAGKESKIEPGTLLSLFASFRINHNFVLDMYLNDEKKLRTKATTNSINTRGSINLTDKWSVGIGNIGYDFIRKGMTYPDFSITRNLHCWNLNVSWQPQLRTYNFFIGVNTAPLDFLKIPYRRNQYDATRVGF